MGTADYTYFFAARLTSRGANSTMSQNINLVAGAFYRLSYRLQNEFSAASNFTGDLNFFSASIGSNVVDVLRGAPAMDYGYRSFLFPAPASTAPLTFTFRQVKTSHNS